MIGRTTRSEHASPRSELSVLMIALSVGPGPRAGRHLRLNRLTARQCSHRVSQTGVWSSRWYRVISRHSRQTCSSTRRGRASGWVRVSRVHSGVVRANNPTGRPSRRARSRSAGSRRPPRTAPMPGTSSTRLRCHTPATARQLPRASRRRPGDTGGRPVRRLHRGRDCPPGRSRCALGPDRVTGGGDRRAATVAHSWPLTGTGS
jgi:hypothetical protein